MYQLCPVYTINYFLLSNINRKFWCISLLNVFCRSRFIWKIVGKRLESYFKIWGQIFNLILVYGTSYDVFPVWDLKSHGTYLKQNKQDFKLGYCVCASATNSNKLNMLCNEYKIIPWPIFNSNNCSCHWLKL